MLNTRNNDTLCDFRFTGTGALKDVEYTVTISFDKGNPIELNRSLASWSPGYAETVEMPVGSGVPRTYRIVGRGKLDLEEVIFQQGFKN